MPPTSKRPLRAFYHRCGTNPCGGVLFFLKSEPDPGEILSSGNVVLVDGSEPLPGDHVICSSCHLPVQGEWFTAKCIDEEKSHEPANE